MTWTTAPARMATPPPFCSCAVLSLTSRRLWVSMTSRRDPSLSRQTPPPWFLAVFFVTSIRPPDDTDMVEAPRRYTPPPLSSAVLPSTISCVPVPLTSRRVSFISRWTPPPPFLAVFFVTVIRPPDDTDTAAK